MPDVTLLILQDHAAMREMFATLDGLRDQPEQAGEVWAELAVLLEVHACAEEEHFFPAMLQHVPDSEEVTKGAIIDHDNVRKGIRQAQGAEVGSEQWWQGVDQTREANDHHLDEEEHDDLPECLRHMSLAQRTKVGVRFRDFKDHHQHARGLSFADRGDPERYVKEYRPT